MENLPKTRKRGRPRKIPEPRLGEPGRKLRQMSERMPGLTPFDVPTERTAANRYYADKAREALPELSKSFRAPENPALWAEIRVGIDWILGRTTVLSELGRMMTENPSPEDVGRFQDVLLHIAERHAKMTARGAAAYARGVRLGETSPRRDRVAALHRELNAAINYHRRRFPESSWADVLAALEHTEGQIRKKVR